MGRAARIALFFLPMLLVSVPGFPGYDGFVDIHPAGWSESVAVCINARGEVAGYGVTGRGERGFLWSGGAIAEIIPPGADSARASWVNGNGDVAGTAVSGGVPHAFLLLNDGRYLDPTPGWAFSTAVFVGEDGTVAGAGEFGAYVSRNGLTEILPGFTEILAGNAAGQLVGRKQNAASLYDPGTGYRDLTPPLAAEAYPTAINESGLVSLTSSSGGAERGFVYSDGWFIQMTPQGWETSRAMAVNNGAAVAGFGDYQGTRRGFVRKGADYEFIAFPGWASTEAVSLNDDGQVTGSGLTAAGERHAFVASPAGTSPAAGSDQGAAASGGGGCAMVAPAAGRGISAGSAIDLLVLASPLLALSRRRFR